MPIGGLAKVLGLAVGVEELLCEVGMGDSGLGTALKGVGDGEVVG